MTNMLFYVLLLGLSASFMDGAVRFSGVNRTFALLQRGIMEYSVVTCDETNEPYYDQELLSEAISSYFASNLPRYVDKYTTAIYFINTDGTMCMNDKCQRVKVSLATDVNLFFTFKKAMIFSISTLGGGE